MEGDNERRRGLPWRERERDRERERERERDDGESGGLRC
jgi:hypothetical protein